MKNILRTGRRTGSTVVIAVIIQHEQGGRDYCWNLMIMGSG